MVSEAKQDDLYDSDGTQFESGSSGLYDSEPEQFECDNESEKQKDDGCRKKKVEATKRPRSPEAERRR